MEIIDLLKNGFEIWDEGVKLDYVIGGITTDGKVWIRVSEDGAKEVKIYDVIGDKVEIKVRSK